MRLPTTSIATALACATTNTSPTAGRLPAARSKAPARTSSKIAWNDPACGGPSKWLKPTSNSELSTCQGILIATGNSTSNRTSAAYTPPGPSFQSSHNQMKRIVLVAMCTALVPMVGQNNIDTYRTCGKFDRSLVEPNSLARRQTSGLSGTSNGLAGYSRAPQEQLWPNGATLGS